MILEVSTTIDVLIPLGRNVEVFAVGGRAEKSGSGNALGIWGTF